MKNAISSCMFVLLAVVGTAAPTAQSQLGRPCERANRALLLSAQREAESEFWLQVARCLSDPGGDVLAGMRDAWSARRAAESRALHVFQARESACAQFGHVIYEPQIEPEEFGTSIDNPYFPLESGRVLVREKQTAEGVERIETSTSPQTVEIGGIDCRIVREYETLDGVLVEDSRNWVAQRADGTVWYFGEQSMEYEDEILSDLSGSWRYGTDGALPGILMLAEPELGALYRQEFLLGSAEDVAQVVRLDETVIVPAGTFHHCLVIMEWDPLEPFEYFLSFIAPHVGLVLEIDMRTGERSELVEILH